MSENEHPTRCPSQGRTLNDIKRTYRSPRSLRSLAGVTAVAVLAATTLGSCTPPTPNAGFDYQLGVTYPPPTGVTVVSRDREAPVVPGAYNICYVNGFQAQTEDEAWWLQHHPDLVLRDGAGRPIKDPDWNELVLDISTEAKRTALAGIVGEWITGCAASGFQGLEVDNLDTYSRPYVGGRITENHAVAYMRLLADRAHAAGLAVSQKNTSEIAHRRAEMATDFAIAEECNRWDECDVYTAAYNDLVFVIEYRPIDFAEGCREFPQLSIVLRDVELETQTRPQDIC